MRVNSDTHSEGGRSDSNHNVHVMIGSSTVQWKWDNKCLTRLNSFPLFSDIILNKVEVLYFVETTEHTLPLYNHDILLLKLHS